MQHKSKPAHVEIQKVASANASKTDKNALSHGGEQDLEDTREHSDFHDSNACVFVSRTTFKLVMKTAARPQLGPAYRLSAVKRLPVYRKMAAPTTPRGRNPLTVVRDGPGGGLQTLRRGWQQTLSAGTTLNFLVSQNASKHVLGTQAETFTNMASLRDLISRYINENSQKGYFSWTHNGKEYFGWRIYDDECAMQVEVDAGSPKRLIQRVDNWFVAVEVQGGQVLCNHFGPYSTFDPQDLVWHEAR
eukprot:TRINITY_DN19504_c0_g1_i1.p1 TRINITY_DN19504_c0_g1~~TRINITY_DN19504_c0_g1_i1.p1  ORF type:complete len:246 (-),score=37.22 TRINITY_DN19504_c0_g1_i1:107-844(-)